MLRRCFNPFVLASLTFVLLLGGKLARENFLTGWEETEALDLRAESILVDPAKKLYSGCVKFNYVVAGQRYTNRACDIFNSVQSRDAAIQMAVDYIETSRPVGLFVRYDFEDTEAAYLVSELRTHRESKAFYWSLFALVLSIICFVIRPHWLMRVVEDFRPGFLRK